MQWQCVQGRGLSSALIGWFGGGGYSHIDVITPHGFLRGARSDVRKGIPAGYQDRPQFYDDWNKRTVFTLSVTPEQEARYWEFSNAQLGKPYDKRGILQYASGQFRDWRAADSWFCSEEVAYNLEFAGICPPLYEDANRVDPGDCAFIFSALGAKWETFLDGK
jgi:hypothetical protein